MQFQSKDLPFVAELIILLNGSSPCVLPCKASRNEDGPLVNKGIAGASWYIQICDRHPGTCLKVETFT